MNKFKVCHHPHIIIVTETPKGIKDGKTYFQLPKGFVQCADCREILPVRLVTQEERFVDLINP